jgi:hypothetical protein
MKNVFVARAGKQCVAEFSELCWWEGRGNKYAELKTGLQNCLQFLSLLASHKGSSITIKETRSRAEDLSCQSLDFAIALALCYDKLIGSYSTLHAAVYLCVAWERREEDWDDMGRTQKHLARLRSPPTSLEILAFGANLSFQAN